MTAPSSQAASHALVATAALPPTRLKPPLQGTHGAIPGILRSINSDQIRLTSNRDGTAALLRYPCDARAWL